MSLFDFFLLLGVLLSFEMNVSGIPSTSSIFSQTFVVLSQLSKFRTCVLSNCTSICCFLPTIRQTDFKLNQFAVPKLNISYFLQFICRISGGDQMILMSFMMAYWSDILAFNGPIVDISWQVLQSRTSFFIFVKIFRIGYRFVFIQSPSPFGFATNFMVSPFVSVCWFPHKKCGCAANMHFLGDNAFNTFPEVVSVDPQKKDLIVFVAFQWRQDRASISHRGLARDFRV